MPLTGIWVGRRLTGVLMTTAALLVLPAAPTAAQTAGDDALRQDIQRLLEVTGAARMGVEMASMMSGQILDMVSKQGDVPPKALDVAKSVLTEEFKKAFEGTGGLMPELVSVYARHFTHDEVKALLAFYATQVGQKVIATMPAIFQESAAAGQQWAAKNMPRVTSAIQARLKAEGIIK